MYLLIVILLIVFLGALFFCSYSISSPVYLRSLCRNKKAQGQIALTFDDGADPQITPKVLDLLKQRGAKATFLIIGSKAKAHPEFVQRIVQEGHELGNHRSLHQHTYTVKSPNTSFYEVLHTTHT